MGRRSITDPRLLGDSGLGGLGQFFPDTCTIGPSARGAFNPQTGKHAPASSSAIYSGPCEITAWPDGGRKVVAREELVIQRSFWVCLPTPAGGIEKDHVVVVTAAADAGLVGRRLVVRDVTRGSTPTGRRLVCEEVLG